MPLNRPPLFQPLRFVIPAPAVQSEQAPADERPRGERVSELAYYRAQSRGFEPGHEVEDWLAAEAEIDRLDAGSH